MMCQKCVDAMHKYFPDISDEEMGNWAMSFTCFPFGSFEQFEEQLKRIKKIGLKKWMAKCDAIDNKENKK